MCGPGTPSAAGVGSGSGHEVPPQHGGHSSSDQQQQGQQQGQQQQQQEQQQQQQQQGQHAPGSVGLDSVLSPAQLQAVLGGVSERQWANDNDMVEAIIK